MNLDSKGLYIHIPFCKSICSYCDFCKVIYNDDWVYTYLSCLTKEILDNYRNEEIETIYIGGGTPSSLPPKHLVRLFKIFKLFNIRDLKEFTFECNLNDINEELLEVLKNAHVTRLSIGIESFNLEKLKLLNRNHTYMDAKIRLKQCRDFGFNNINIDFIYGFAFDTLKSIREDLKKIISLKPEHISTYSLILEKGTFLYLDGYERLNEDEDAKIYSSICKILKKKGYNHYEVSNFALKGYETIHNLLYWHNREYYGFGVGASGYIDKIRYTNTLSLTKYLKNDYTGEKVLLTKKDIMDNHLMLGFRLVKGFNIEEFENLYNVKLEDTYPIKPLLRNGDLMLKKGNIFINPDKLYIMNEILLKMI